MKLIYHGKTKDVYLLEDGKVQLRFKDDMTGKDGVFDPGENQVGLTVAGMGELNLRVSEHFFRLLEAQGIPTHYVSSDPEQATMVVQNCAPFGQGLEVIHRNYAVGSFLRRYGLYAQEMQPLDDYVEFTLKDDERQDPLITEDGLVQLGLLTRDEYRVLYDLTVRIAQLLTQTLADLGLTLIDIKFEYGRTPEGEIVLMDELSAGNMRVYREGEKLGPEAISQAVLG